MREAILYQKLDNNLVQCLACKFKCRIDLDKTGICGVRKNIAGKLNLLVYGRPVSVAVDPMEKKPLFHFLPGNKILSIGTFGCNFGCGFCQNFEISQILESKGKSESAEYIERHSDKYTPKAIVDYCVQEEIPAVAFTYNEPTIFSEYAMDVMKLAKKHNIKGVFVSNGYESEECLDFLDGCIDAYNIDLKSFNKDFYQNICKARLEGVLETIRSICRRGKWLEITTLVIPDKNDSAEELKSAAEFIASVSQNIPWHISAYHPDYQMMDGDDTSIEKLEEAYLIGKKAGLKYVYVGNISSGEHDNTFCPRCDLMLIKREGFKILENKLVEGKCVKCGEQIAGVWQ